MAKEDRLEIQWATFIGEVRLSTQSSPARAIMRSEVERLYLGSVGGLPFLIIEDTNVPYPATIPWSNVSSVGWVTPPKVETIK